VAESDLPLFYAHQLDPEATRMAAFTARDHAAFMAHWRKIMADERTIVKTILVEGEVAGNIVSWEEDGVREVGYWIDKAHWGKGIATRALTLYLELVSHRPLHAHVATHNVGSIRVLEKCGFRMSGRQTDDAEAVDLTLQ
jgi:RimJ/RimL family protein N-acetyltransferase